MDRDFDEEKIIDKMRALRDKREIEILQEQFNKEADRQEKLPESRVLDVKYLGEIGIGDIYLIIEQRQDKNGNLIQIERYCTEDGEVIGGNNRADNYDFVLLSEKYKDRPELLEQLQSLDKGEMLDLSKIEQKRLEEVAKELGMTVEELEKIAEVDSEKGIEKGENEEEISKKEIEKMTTKTEIDVSQKVTDKETMASLLAVQDKGYKKIAVVYSDKLQEDKNSTRFCFVGIKEDGTAEKIDSMEQRYGKNPSKKVNSLNRDGSEIQEKNVQSIYQIKGDNEKQMAVNIGQMGTIEVSFVRTPREDNGEAISIPIETQSIRPTTRETREFMNRQRNNSMKEEINRLEQHKKAGCEDITLKDINDNPYDDTHKHIEINNDYLEKLAKKILENNEIANVYNRQDVKRELIKNIEEKGKLPNEEELIKEVEAEMEQNGQEEHEQPGRYGI